jgi:hypothetical protein
MTLNSLEKTNAELVRDAQALLAKKGWTQNRSEDVNERHCIGGAITCVTFGVEAFIELAESKCPLTMLDAVNDRANALRRGVESTIAEQYGEPMAIETWNDYPGRIYADVEAVLEKTAAKLEEPQWQD